MIIILFSLLILALIIVVPTNAYAQANSGNTELYQTIAAIHDTTVIKNDLTGIKDSLFNKSGNVYTLSGLLSVRQWLPAWLLVGLTATQLNTAYGYTPYNGTSNPNGYISSVPAQSFASLTGKPTTLAGYSISDAYPLSGNPSAFLTSASITGKTNNSDTAAMLATYLRKIDTASLSNRINTKFATPAGTTAQYLRGDGTLATYAGASGATGSYGIVTTSNGLVSSGKRMELYSGTTNGSGIYTVTFGTSYSVAPNVQASLSNQTATNQYLRISSITTTGFTINAYAFNTNTLLGIVSLVSTTSALASVSIDVIVIEK